MASILLVDDDRAIREVFAERLRRAGHELREAASAEAAIAMIRTNRPDAMVLDLSMSPQSMTGIGLLTELHTSGELAKTKVIIFSAFASAVDTSFATQLGVAAVLEKGTITGEQLADKIRSILEDGTVR